MPEKYSKPTRIRFPWMGKSIETERVWLIQDNVYALHRYHSDERLDYIEDERGNHITRREIELAKEKHHEESIEDYEEDRDQGP